MSAGPHRTQFPGRPRCEAAGGTRVAALAAGVTGSLWVRFVAMASFVTEVLTHSGSLEKEDLGTRISRLTRRVEEIKVRAGDRLQLGAELPGRALSRRRGKCGELLGERSPRPGTVRRKGPWLCSGGKSC